jgi:hypothetical protein
MAIFESWNLPGAGLVCVRSILLFNESDTSTVSCNSLRSAEASKLAAFDVTGNTTHDSRDGCCARLDLSAVQSLSQRTCSQRVVVTA